MNSKINITICHLAYLALAFAKKKQENIGSWFELFETLPLLRMFASHTRQLEMIESLLQPALLAAQSSKLELPERVGSFQRMERVAPQVRNWAMATYPEQFAVWTDADWLSFAWVLVFYHQALRTQMWNRNSKKRLLHLDVHCLAISLVVATRDPQTDMLLGDFLRIKEVEKLQYAAERIREGVSFAKATSEWQPTSLGHHKLLKRLLDLSQLPLGLAACEVSAELSEPEQVVIGSQQEVQEVAPHPNAYRGQNHFKADRQSLVSREDTARFAAERYATGSPQRQSSSRFCF